MIIRKVMFGCAVFNTFMFVFNIVISNGNVGSLLAAIFTAITASYCWAGSFDAEKPVRIPFLPESMHEAKEDSLMRQLAASEQTACKYLALLKMILGGKAVDGYNPRTGAFEFTRGLQVPVWKQKQDVPCVHVKQGLCSGPAPNLSGKPCDGINKACSFYNPGEKPGSIEGERTVDGSRLDKLDRIEKAAASVLAPELADLPPKKPVESEKL